MDCRLRQPTIEELAELSDLCLRSKAIWGYDAAFMEACRAELTLRDDDLRSTHLVAAEVDGRLVGIGQVDVTDGCCDLLKLFVEPEMLGAGVGRLLFGWCCDTARGLGAREMVIESDPGAVAFYRRMGAKGAGTAPSGSVAGRVLPRLVVALA